MTPNDEVDLLYIDGSRPTCSSRARWTSRSPRPSPACAGDTASGGGNKPATLETGAQVNVPLFVNIGERVRVDTRSGDVRLAGVASRARRSDQRREAVFALYQHDLTGRPLDEPVRRDAAPFTRALAHATRATTRRSSTS